MWWFYSSDFLWHGAGLSFWIMWSWFREHYGADGLSILLAFDLLYLSVPCQPRHKQLSCSGLLHETKVSDSSPSSPLQTASSFFFFGLVLAFPSFFISTPLLSCLHLKINSLFVFVSFLPSLLLFCLLWAGNEESRLPEPSFVVPHVLSVARVSTLFLISLVAPLMLISSGRLAFAAIVVKSLASMRLWMLGGKQSLVKSVMRFIVITSFFSLLYVVFEFCSCPDACRFLSYFCCGETTASFAQEVVVVALSVVAASHTFKPLFRSVPHSSGLLAFFLFLVLARSIFCFLSAVCYSFFVALIALHFCWLDPLRFFSFWFVQAFSPHLARLYNRFGHRCLLHTRALAKVLAYVPDSTAASKSLLLLSPPPTSMPEAYLGRTAIRQRGSGARSGAQAATGGAANHQVLSAGNRPVLFRLRSLYYNPSSQLSVPQGTFDLPSKPSSAAPSRLLAAPPSPRTDGAGSVSLSLAHCQSHMHSHLSLVVFSFVRFRFSVVVASSFSELKSGIFLRPLRFIIIFLFFFLPPLPPPLLLPLLHPVPILFLGVLPVPAASEVKGEQPTLSTTASSRFPRLLARVLPPVFIFPCNVWNGACDSWCKSFRAVHQRALPFHPRYSCSSTWWGEIYFQRASEAVASRIAAGGHANNQFLADLQHTHWCLSIPAARNAWFVCVRHENSVIPLSAPSHDPFFSAWCRFSFFRFHSMSCFSWFPYLSSRLSRKLPPHLDLEIPVILSALVEATLTRVHQVIFSVASCFRLLCNLFVSHISIQCMPVFVWSICSPASSLSSVCWFWAVSTSPSDFILIA